jgi:adenosylcobinamide-GDP ribazoletransferase
MGAFSETWREEFLAALTFLTRLPLAWWPSQRTDAEELPSVASLASAAWAFPLVGTIIGAIGGILYVIAAGIALPTLAAALLAIGATALATGGLHEDGLADTADGFGGGAERDDKLAIMRDSRTGVYGVLVLIFSVGLRGVALGQILEPWHVFGALIAAHALARGLLPIAMRVLDPARSDGLGAEAGRPEQNVVLWAGGIAIIACLLGAGIRPGLTAIIAATAVMASIGWLARRQIGGYTGDVLGAMEQGGEIAALLTISAWVP